MTTMPGGAAVRSLQCGGETSPRNHLTPTILATDRRGFVKLVTEKLVALQARIMVTCDVSAAVALADVGEFIALLVDAADRNGRIAPPEGWQPDARFGYHRYLIAADGWEPRRKRLVRAGALLTDDFGRVLAISPAWYRQLTDPRVRKPDGSEDQLRYVIVQRTRFAATTTVLRRQLDGRGRITSGTSRLLPVLLHLCTPVLSRGPDGLIIPTQREHARTWQVDVKTVNKVMAELRRIGFVEPPEVHRGPNAGPQHHDRVGVFSDWLANRMWVVADDLPHDGGEPAQVVGDDQRPSASSGDPRPTGGSTVPTQEPAPGATIAARPDGSTCSDELFQDHAASVPEPPPASGGLPGGFLVQTSLGTPTGRESDTRVQASGGPRAARGPHWEPGPATLNREYTQHAVEHLVANAPALHELLDRFEGKATGAGVRAAVRAELCAAELAYAHWVASGRLPSAAERDRLDAVARLARWADTVLRLGIDVTPALVYEDPEPGSRWHRADGVLDPHLAVVLLASRLRPFTELARRDPRFVDTAGNWRQRPAAPTDAQDGVNDEKVDLHALLAEVERSLSAAPADRRPR
jgi:hypothetical protein